MRKSRRLLVVKESVYFTVLALSVSALDDQALSSDTSSNSSLISALPNSTLYDKHSNSSSPSASPYGNPYGLTGNFNPSMAIIVIVLLSAFFFMGFFSIYVRRCADEDDSGGRVGGGNGRRWSTAPQGLDKSIIETFPVFSYSLVKGLKKGKEALECAVCLSEFEDDETLRLLPRCGHAFHPDCIDMWLFSHSTCPLCRTSLVPDSKNIVHQGMGVNSAGQLPQQAADHVVIFVGSVNEVLNRVDDQGRGTNETNTSYAELHGTSPVQARAWNEQSLLINGSRPLERPRQNLRRSHSTGHSLIRLGGNPEHPSEFYISTDDRYVLDFVQETIRCPRAGLHRSSSYAAICHAGSESQGFLNSEAFANDRERLWRYPSSAEPLALQEVRACTHPHSSRGAEVEPDLEFGSISQSRFNPRISSDRWSIPLHSPVFLRTFSDSRAPYFQQQETTSTSSVSRESTPRDLKAYLQSVKKGIKWFTVKNKNMTSSNGSEDTRRSSKSPEQGGSHS